tara:strand:+ start:249 stop:890 length:642 start_codon:yes stop_codon:yes gene_type:complete
MASNEHRNLQDPNIHNPKGYQGASNETVLTKGVGSAGYQNGALEWTQKSNVGAVNYKIQGYGLGIANFQHGEDIADNKSPFIMDVSYGASTVAGGSINPSTLFRIGQSCVIHKNSKVIGINGWLTSSGTSNVTIAICKATPNPASAENIVPIVIDEFVVVGGGNNGLLVNFSQSEITLPSLSTGDIIFPMIKEGVDRTGSNLYINLNIESVVI